MGLETGTITLRGVANATPVLFVEWVGLKEQWLGAGNASSDNLDDASASGLHRITELYWFKGTRTLEHLQGYLQRREASGQDTTAPPADSNVDNQDEEWVHVDSENSSILSNADSVNDETFQTVLRADLVSTANTTFDEMRMQVDSRVSLDELRLLTDNDEYPPLQVTLTTRRSDVQSRTTRMDVTDPNTLRDVLDNLLTLDEVYRQVSDVLSSELPSIGPNQIVEFDNDRGQYTGVGELVRAVFNTLSHDFNR